MTTSSSPWLAALGPSHGELDPALADYFGTIPEGKVGRGHGVFTTVGTPRRWLWPVLAVLGRLGIVFPVWERDVRFEIENRPTAHGLTSTRVFHFSTGPKVMRDEVRWSRGRLLQGLGTPAFLVVELAASAVDGRLELRSRRTFLRFRGATLRLPIAPSVHLVESVHRVAGGDRQHVSLVLELPVIGRIYEYAGTFEYGLGPA